MDTNLPPAPERLRLLPGSPRRVEVISGTRVQVEQGRIWLTLTDLADDVVLIAGQSFELPHGGRLVIESWPSRGIDPIAEVRLTRQCIAAATASNAKTVSA